MMDCGSRIVHVVAPAAVGGLETVVRSLARAQQERGALVSIVAIVDGGERHPFVAAAIGDGLDVRSLVGAGRAYWREIAAVVRAIEPMGRPAVIHSHGYRPDVVAGVAAGRLRVPRVSTVHGFTGGDLKNRFYEWVQVRSLRRFNRVVAVSDSVAGRLKTGGVPAEALTTIPNGHAPRLAPMPRHEARRALGIPEGVVAIGWVGRLGPEKAPETLVRAMAQLGGDAVAVVVGEGPEQDRCKALAETLGVAQRIRWCGPIAEAGRLFAGFDCYALTSMTEGTPMVLLEAAAAGVPIVTTAVGGIPDLLGDREAWLVPAGHPEKVAVAIGTILGSPDEGRRRATAARRRVEESFGADRWVERYHAVYREVGR